MRRGVIIEISSHRWTEYATIAVMVAVLLCDLIAPLSKLNGIVAAIAALAQAARMMQWKGWRTLREPLLWVLHLGYAWLVVGLALKALSLLGGGAIGDKWLHAITIGAFATLVLAVMTRASLGHTGRALMAPKPMFTSYILISLAAFVRVFGPVIAPDHYDLTIATTGALWIATFVLFVVVYGPILTKPRVDGKPG
jgi:uncharacterized protein involved in response to NO